MVVIILVIVVLGTILIYFFSPSARYKQAVFLEYYHRTHKDIETVDKDLVSLFKVMQKKKLSPQTAGLVLYTFLEKGKMQGVEHLIAILSGEKYESSDEIAEKTE